MKSKGLSILGLLLFCLIFCFSWEMLFYAGNKRNNVIPTLEEFMKRLSLNTISFLIVVSLLASIVFTYLWATLTAPTSTVFAVLTLVAAAVFVISTNLITKR